MSDQLNLEPIKARMECRYVFTASDGHRWIDGGRNQLQDLKSLLSEVYRQRELIGMLESDLETYRGLVSNKPQENV